MDKSILKQKLYQYEGDLLLLSNIINQINIKSQKDESRENKFLLFSLEKSFSVLWDNHKDHLSHNNYEIKLPNLEELIRTCKEMKKTINNSEINDIDKITLEIRNLSTNTYFLNKIGGFKHSQNDYNFLPLLAQNKDFDRLLEVMISSNKEVAKLAFEALVDYMPQKITTINEAILAHDYYIDETTLANTINKINPKLLFQTKYHPKALIEGDYTQEEMVSIVKGLIPYTDDESPLQTYWDDDNELLCYCSTLAYKNNLFELGHLLYDYEVIKDKEKTEVLCNSIDQSILHLIKNKEEFLKFVNKQTYKPVVLDLVEFLEHTGLVSSAIDQEIASVLLNKIDQDLKEFAVEQFNFHQHNLNPYTISLMRNELIDHLKVVSEHLLDYYPARMKVKEAMPLGIQYTKK